MGATEVQFIQGMATLLTPSIKVLRKDLRDRYKLRRVVEVSPHRARTAIAAQ
jgi:hypothetical protein